MRSERQELRLPAPPALLPELGSSACTRLLRTTKPWCQRCSCTKDGKDGPGRGSAGEEPATETTQAGTSSFFSLFRLSLNHYLLQILILHPSSPLPFSQTPSIPPSRHTKRLQTPFTCPCFTPSLLSAMSVQIQHTPCVTSAKTLLALLSRAYKWD